MKTTIPSWLYFLLCFLGGYGFGSILIDLFWRTH